MADVPNCFQDEPIDRMVGHWTKSFLTRTEVCGSTVYANGLLTGAFDMLSVSSLKSLGTQNVCLSIKKGLASFIN
jgi:hypothetical protein